MKTPHRPLPVSPGPHVLEYRARFAPTVRRSFSVPKSSPYHVENLLTISHNYPVEVSHALYEGKDAALLLVETGAATANLTIDQQTVSGRRRWIRMSPGRHELETVHESPARREAQVIELRPNELNPVFLLPRELMQVPGSYRLTLGNVLSPLPIGKRVRFEFGGAAVPFMNDAREGRTRSEQPGHLRLHSFITAAKSEQEAVAMLRIEFDEPMRSLVFFCDCSFDLGFARMHVDYRVLGGDWQRLDIDAERVTEQVQVPAGGTTLFQLRARMTVHQEPLTWATARFLCAYIDNVEGSHPAFALVADPDPDVAKLK